jgi:hypothetical protein
MSALTTDCGGRGTAIGACHLYILHCDQVGVVFEPVVRTVSILELISTS